MPEPAGSGPGEPAGSEPGVEPGAREPAVLVTPATTIALRLRPPRSKQAAGRSADGQLGVIDPSRAHRFHPLGQGTERQGGLPVRL